ncbi:MAG: hypothetical protein WC578_00550 [Candidatus Omnitrophota bacterium]
MKFAFVFLICLLGMMLPWRLRVIYCDILGWILQGVYMAYFFILKTIISSLKKNK